MTSEPRVHVAKYTVCCLPEGDVNRNVCTVMVEYRGRGLWAVTDGHAYLGSDGRWGYESAIPLYTEAWRAAYLFPEDEALRLAKEAAARLYAELKRWQARRKD